MKDNCLKTDGAYDDPKRHDKAEALNYAIHCVKTVEPKKGKWVLGDSGQFKNVVSTCSVCGKKYLLGNIDYNYCPNCGARNMRGGE